MSTIDKAIPPSPDEDFITSMQGLENLSTDELQQKIDALEPSPGDFSYKMAYLAGRKIVENSGLKTEVSKLRSDLETADQTINRHEETIRKVSDIGFRQNIEARTAQEAATVDELTGLPNRRGFFQKATEVLSRVKDPENYAVAVLDADNLKLLNDNEGHAAGDEGIKSAANYAAAAKYLEENVRKGDLLAIGRAGGDEIFALFHLVPNDPKYDNGTIYEQSPEERELRAKAILTRLIEGFEKDVVAKNNKFAKAKFGLSGGIAVGGQGKELLVMIQEADQKMYEAKQAKQAVNGKYR